jgi:hypothetical protein
MAELDELRIRRIEACRLDPKFALDEFEDAKRFLDDRALLTLTACCSLPSLFGACHEEPTSSGKPGFGQWPKTRWWWGGALETAPEVVATRLHRGKTLYLTSQVAGLMDPLCRVQVARAELAEFGDQAARLMTHLASAGPSTTDDVKLELGLETGAYHRVRRTLESRGAILSRTVGMEGASGGHRHMSELRRWDQVVAESPGKPEDSFAALVRVVVEAAVLIPEVEARRAFTWSIPDNIVERSIEDGHIRRVAKDTLAVAAT